MTKILIAECKQEVSTFNPDPCGYEDFAVRQGTEMFDFHQSVRYEVGGAMEVFASLPDVQLVPTYSAIGITSGGILSKSGWLRLADEFLNAVRSAPPVDAVYFSMHGALASEVEFDPEGYLLAETRKILGEEIPIVVSLDLHGILTEKMLEHSDAVVAFHTYPHVDFFETGQRAARLLLRILCAGARPVTAKVDIPALVRGDELITATGLYGQSIRLAQSVERRTDGLSAAVLIGNPFTDVPELQSCVVVVLDGNASGAQEEALKIAENFWSNHERMHVPLTSVEAMTKIALEHEIGTLVLVDAADATSSGASGDSNVIVRALLEAGYRGKLLAPIVDEPAVDRAFVAGVGATISLTVGGTLDPQRFKALPLKVTVRMLSDGRVRSESFGGEWQAGRTAVLEAGNLTLVATSRAVSLYDRSLFYAHGQDPRNFSAVVVKSPHCQHHMYAAWCARLVHVDAAGSTSANLRSLGHFRCRRPIFPLDAEVRFAPVAKLFQRPRFRP
jgi:microcystin degradation protein MlrC